MEVESHAGRRASIPTNLRRSNKITTPAARTATPRPKELQVRPACSKALANLHKSAKQQHWHAAKQSTWRPTNDSDIYTLALDLGAVSAIAFCRAAWIPPGRFVPS